MHTSSKERNEVSVMIQKYLQYYVNVNAHVPAVSFFSPSIDIPIKSGICLFLKSRTPWDNGTWIGGCPVAIDFYFLFLLALAFLAGALRPKICNGCTYIGFDQAYFIFCEGKYSFDSHHVFGSLSKKQKWWWKVSLSILQPNWQKLAQRDKKDKHLQQYQQVEMIRKINETIDW